MNVLQEAALNHAKGTKLDGDGFASTREMNIRNLTWVVAKTQVLVDPYPVWRDIIEVDTWIVVSGMNSVLREWLVWDSNTGDILARASSKWVMMNTKTRKLSKIPAEVREEMDVCFLDSPPVLEMDSRKLPKLEAKTANCVRTGLTPKWNDLDMNQHVNNVKYVSWIIESVPLQILKTHKLVGISLEYRRECMSDSVLQSLTCAVDNGSDDPTKADFTECEHLLCLESGEEIVRGMTKWECPKVPIHVA